MDRCGDRQIGLVPVLVVIVVAALLYAWALPQFWVSPDEGAHLMSGWRIHYGEVPLADYDSRQPLYSYIHAFSQLFFDNTLFSGRLVSLISTLVSGLLIFFIGRAVQSDVVGTVAAVLFLFSPLTLEYATIVQTQPVVILFECAAVLILLTRDGTGWMLLSGILLACAFYVRESSVAIVLAAFLWFFFMDGGIRTLLRKGIPLVAGYVGVALAVILTYSQWLSAAEIWVSPINPLRLAVNAIHSFTSSAPTGTGAVIAPAAPIDRKLGTIPPSTEYLLLGAQFIAMLLVAVVGTLVLWFRGEKGGADKSKFWFLVFWLFTLAALYTYQFSSRGFYPGYLREFEPILALLAAVGLTSAVCRFGVRRSLIFSLPALAIVLVPVAVVSGKLPFWVEDFTLAACSGFAVLALLCVGDIPWRKALLPLVGTGVVLTALFLLRRVGGPLSDASFAVLLVTGVILVMLAGFLLRWTGVDNIGPRLLLGASAFGLALSFAGVAEKGGFEFQGRWSVPVVTRAVEAIKANTGPDDEIMSGGVIWSYLADRYPYMKVDHPLGFYDVLVDDEETESFYQYYLEHPPAIVVLDGKTKKTWFKSTRLKAAVERDYVPLLDQGPESKAVVLIHRSRLAR